MEEFLQPNVTATDDEDPTTGDLPNKRSMEDFTGPHGNLVQSVAQREQTAFARDVQADNYLRSMQVRDVNERNAYDTVTAVPRAEDPFAVYSTREQPQTREGIVLRPELPMFTERQGLREYRETLRDVETADPHRAPVRTVINQHTGGPRTQTQPVGFQKVDTVGIALPRMTRKDTVVPVAHSPLTNPAVPPPTAVAGHRRHLQPHDVVGRSRGTMRTQPEPGGIAHTQTTRLAFDLLTEPRRLQYVLPAQYGRPATRVQLTLQPEGQASTVCQGFGDPGEQPADLMRAAQRMRQIMTATTEPPQRQTVQSAPEMHVPTTARELPATEARSNVSAPTASVVPHETHRSREPPATGARQVVPVDNVPTPVAATRAAKRRRQPSANAPSGIPGDPDNGRRTASGGKVRREQGKILVEAAPGPTTITAPTHHAGRARGSQAQQPQPGAGAVVPQELDSVERAVGGQQPATRNPRLATIAGNDNLVSNTATPLQVYIDRPEADL
jgi:hypothetical protein